MVADGLKTTSAPWRPRSARALREVAVVADVDSDLAVPGLEDRITEIARLEVELLVEARSHVGDVVLAVAADERAVGVDHRGGVVVDAGLHALVDGATMTIECLLREGLELLDGGAGDRLGRVVPAQRLAGAEVRSVENILQHRTCTPSRAGLLDEGKVRLERLLLDVRDGSGLVVETG